MREAVAASQRYLHCDVKSVAGCRDGMPCRKCLGYAGVKSTFLRLCRFLKVYPCLLAEPCGLVSYAGWMILNHE